MIQLSITADASDFASDDQLAAFFDAIKSAFAAARASAAAMARSSVSAPAVPPKPKMPVLAAPGAAQEATEADTEEASTDADEPPAKKPRAKRGAKAAAKAEAPKPAETPAADAEVTEADVRKAAMKLLSPGAGQGHLVEAAMKACDVTKFSEIPAHRRAAMVAYWNSGGETDLEADLIEADLARDAEAVA